MFQYLWLGLLFIVGVESTCVSVHCLRCSSAPDHCPSCQNDTCIDYANVTSDCKIDFQVSVSMSPPEIHAGDDVTLTCVHNLPNFNWTFGWMKDGVELQGNHNTSKLLLQKVLKKDLYSCYVNSSCGSYTSSQLPLPIASKGYYVLMYCGITAAVLILLMSLIMKLKMNRENAKHRERMAQRAQGAAS